MKGLGYKHTSTQTRICRIKGVIGLVRKIESTHQHINTFMSDAKEKLKALQLTIDKLEKTYGKGTVMKLSDEKVMDVPAISTGSIGLDVALDRKSVV